jgi:hypothetical protein
VLLTEYPGIYVATEAISCCVLSTSSMLSMLGVSPTVHAYIALCYDILDVFDISTLLTVKFVLR